MKTNRMIAKLALPKTVIPCKVDATYGAIKIGDLLVASPPPGHAMLAEEGPRGGRVIAMALEGLPAGKGRVNVLVMSR